MIASILKTPHISMTSQLPSTILPCTIVRTRVLKRYLPKYYRLEEVLRSFSFDATHTHTCIRQKQLLCTKEISFCCHEISLFFFKLFKEPKLAKTLLIFLYWNLRSTLYSSMIHYFERNPHYVDKYQQECQSKIFFFKRQYFII